ncbi:MAG: tRNA uridine(34) 5-carboxymethylaminomethyl modification radical SAM/GNAT enzyme Elp3 [Anaerolineae bacterium]|nr:tRNA uridine(34) 5-carboxymethylaminomethyl modification radical SAM/GNAT enzyme Elp3 [Anaerolineae bacterium]
MPSDTWIEDHQITPEKIAAARAVLEDLRRGLDLLQATHRHPLPGGGMVAKHVLVAVYRQLVASGEWEEDEGLLARIRMKPVRSLSGVTTVTVLTEPRSCPGTCIFCPEDARMPKSYLPDEPGAARAYQNAFDPYRQVCSRLEAYQEIGHPTHKIELLILGGTWDAYPRQYQEWFVRRCFDALNGQDSPTLEAAHRMNERAARRNVGLVVETRPDEITLQTLVWLRQLGITKVQMGAQSMDDRLLALNRRGHTVADTLRACALLRALGFKIVLHWMPNLLGATLESDRQDFARLWEGCCPDEIKIYPTQLLENSPLFAYWQRGEYAPYTTEQLIGLIADLKPMIPPYCRVNRVIRDIPARHVVAGNKRTSLRQDVLAELARRGQHCRCVRCREVRGRAVVAETLRLDDTVYKPLNAEEHFLSFVTPEDKIAAYLRLSLPGQSLTEVADLSGRTAMIRELHVYGQALGFGSEQNGAAQHIGLGTVLLQEAERIASAKGFRKLAVIAAVGTRLYYEARGFERGDLYMVKEI